MEQFKLNKDATFFLMSASNGKVGKIFNLVKILEGIVRIQKTLRKFFDHIKFETRQKFINQLFRYLIKKVLLLLLRTVGFIKT